MAAGLSVGWDEEIVKVQRELTATMPMTAAAESKTGASTSSYNDNSSLVIYTSDDKVLRAVKDWWGNRQRRERAAGGV